jgi:hypothetical protein
MSASVPKPAPAILGWYRAYAVAMALLYLATAGIGVVAHIRPPPQAAPAASPVVMLGFGILAALLGLVLLAAFAAALLLPPKPWVWIYHLVLITVGMTSACCLPACIALLVFWLKPETRAYFGRD